MCSEGVAQLTVGRGRCVDLCKDGGVRTADELGEDCWQLFISCAPNPLELVGCVPLVIDQAQEPQGLHRTR